MRICRILKCEQFTSQGAIVHPTIKDAYIADRHIVPMLSTGYILLWIFLSGKNDIKANINPEHNDRKFFQIDRLLCKV
jgi:hypothetical protein